MTMLPTIKLHGLEFYNIAGVVTADRYRRNRTNGLAIHHSVTATAVPDRNFNGTSMDEEIAHIKAINAYHVQLGYGGFGYNGCVFESGRLYLVGDGGGARAHVANRNHELAGLCMIGTFTQQNPPLPIVLGAGQFVLWGLRTYGLIPVRGHREWATAGWGTACPGDGGMRVMPDLLRVAATLNRVTPEA